METEDTILEQLEEEEGNNNSDKSAATHHQSICYDCLLHAEHLLHLLRDHRHFRDEFFFGALRQLQEG